LATVPDLPLRLRARRRSGVVAGAFCIWSSSMAGSSSAASTYARSCSGMTP